MASGPNARWMERDTLLLVVYVVLGVFCMNGPQSASAFGIMGAWCLGIFGYLQYKPSSLKLLWGAVLALQTACAWYLMQEPRFDAVRGSYANALFYTPLTYVLVLCFDAINWWLHKDHFAFPVRGDIEVPITGRLRTRWTDYLFGFASILLPLFMEICLTP